MKIMVIGYARHGKDTFCEQLQKLTGLTWKGSSAFACEHFIFDQLKDQYGYATPQECYDDRANHRKEWFDAIVQYNRYDAAHMGREIFKHYDVYCGCRNRREFEAIRKAGLYDLSVWVDASKRLQGTPHEVEPETSNELKPTDATILIGNNTWTQLQLDTQCLAKLINA